MSRIFLILTIVLVFSLATTQGAVFREGKMSGMDRMKDPKLSECLKTCPVNLDLSPQCASDEKTYPNTSTIGCMNKCLKALGEELKIVSPGFCAKDVQSA